MTNSEMVPIRCAPDEKDAWKRAAGSPGSLSSWARAQLNQAARLAERDGGPTAAQAMAAKAPVANRPAGPEGDGAALPPDKPDVSRSASSRKPVVCPHGIDLNTAYCSRCA